MRQNTGMPCHRGLLLNPTRPAAWHAAHDQYSTWGHTILSTSRRENAAGRPKVRCRVSGNLGEHWRLLLSVTVRPSSVSSYSHRLPLSPVHAGADKIPHGVASPTFAGHGLARFPRCGGSHQWTWDDAPSFIQSSENRTACSELLGTMPAWWRDQRMDGSLRKLLSGAVSCPLNLVLW